MKTGMMEILYNIPLNTTISDFCYTISPLIKLNSGFKRILAVIEDYIENQTHDWAHESLVTLKEEIQMVEHFYENNQDEEQMEKEITDLTNRYTPSISYRIINGGVIYLTEKSS
jgi:hypothetical protein